MDQLADGAECQLNVGLLLCSEQLAVGQQPLRRTSHLCNHALQLHQCSNKAPPHP